MESRRPGGAPVTRDPQAITALLAASRILGRDCMVTLFVEPHEIDAVSRLVCDVMGVGVDKVRYSPPGECKNAVYQWGEDGDGRLVYVTVHVVPAIVNDNQKQEG